MTTQSRADRGALIALFAAVPLVLAACSTAEPETPVGGGAAPSPADDGQPSAQGTEVAAVTPRLVLSHDGGLQVLDATSLEPVAALPAEGFVRLNPAGDGRHALVSEAGGFQPRDTGTWEAAHGAHS